MNNIAVSILCLAFNHKDYIAQAIEGFLAQQTTFDYEIIIHDDASTDGTADIIREYAEKYPNRIKPIYQSANQYSRGVSINKEFFLPQMQGDYVALCDGDDYWTDPLKLQKQYDALQSHPNCLMCLHKVWDFNVSEEAGKPKKYLPKADLQTGEIDTDSFMKLLGGSDFFNEVCYFFRADAYREYQENYPAFAHAYMKNRVDDMPMLLYFGSKANVYYIADEMAVYRRMNAGSWSSHQSKKSSEEMVAFFKNSVDAIEAFHRFSNDQYTEHLNYIYLYFSFNYYVCIGDYKQVLQPQYDCVWARQSPRYRKRVVLLSKNKRVWGAVFRLYDALRK